MDKGKIFELAVESGLARQVVAHGGMGANWLEPQTGNRTKEITKFAELIEKHLRKEMSAQAAPNFGAATLIREIKGSIDQKSIVRIGTLSFERNFFLTEIERLNAIINGGGNG